MTKAKYRIKNWSSYNKSLVHRGSINLWISEEVCRDWFYCSKADRNNKKANKNEYVANAATLTKQNPKNNLKNLFNRMTNTRKKLSIFIFVIVLIVLLLIVILLIIILVASIIL